MTRLFALLLLIAPFCVSQAVLTHAAAASPVERIAAHIPADALVVIAVPDLRVANDELTHALEAMDRGHLLLGTRPLDQIKTILGFPIGIDERGGAALILMPAPSELPDDESGPALQELVVVVAVTDADAFLRGNFKEIDRNPEHDGMFRGLHARWGDLHALVQSNYVAVSRRLHPLEAIASQQDDRRSISDRLGAEGQAIARQGDAFVFVRSDGCAWHPVQALTRRYPMLTSLLPLPPTESMVLSIDFDPLGFFVRGRTVFPQGSAIERLATAISEGRDANTQATTLDLPDRPFIAAGAFNASTITREVAQTWSGNPWLRRALDVLVEARSADFAAYPAEGFLLNGAMAVFRGGDGEALAHALRTFLDSHADDRTTVTWKTDRFELRRQWASFPDSVLVNLLFGPAGARGVVGHEQHSAFLVPSERRATVATAREAASGAAGGLMENQIIQSMQSWMPRARDAELYIDPAELLRAIGLPSAVRVPRFTPGQPPIGVAVELNPGAAEYIVILPAAVLARLLDFAIEEASDRLGLRVRRSRLE